MTESADPAQSVNRRSSTQTRALVIEAARTLFARYPYPEVTIKRIADDAGVSPPLVMKYFGSKEGLLDAATDFSAVFADAMAAPREELAVRLVTSLLRAHDNGVDPLLAFLYVGGRRDSPESGRSAMQRQFTDRLARRIGGRDARIRAELCCAELLGVAALRRLSTESALSRLTPEALQRLLAERLSTLLAADEPAR